MLPKWRLFPQLRGFRASFGDFYSCLGNFALALIFLGCAYGVAFLAPSAYPTLRPSPAVAGLVGFRCSPPHWWSLRVCGGPFWGGGAVSSFSSCSALGRLLLRLLLEFASVPLPAAPAVFRGVLCRRLPLGGYATFMAPVACLAAAVELCLLGLRCLGCGAWFSTLCRALPPGPAVLRSLLCR